MCIRDRSHKCEPGVPGTGGGAGGAEGHFGDDRVGPAGGSGIVVVRYVI